MTERPAAASPGAQVLLVDLTPAELLRVDGVPRTRTCTSGELAAALEGDELLDLVVVGADAARPATLAQLVRRLSSAAVLVVTTAESDGAVRREISYTPGVPLDIAVHSGLDGLAEEVAAQLARMQEQRRHRQLLATLPRTTVGATRPAPVVDLGPLLERAPVGVVVCEPDGALRGWNRQAAALLGLRSPAPGPRLHDVLPDALGLLASFAGTADPLDSTHPEAGTVATTGTGHDLEVTAVPTLAQDNRPAILLLLVDVTARRRAERDREVLSRQVDLLGRISESLVSTLDTEEALDRLTEALVPELCDWISVQLADGSGRLPVVAVRHWDPAMADKVIEAQHRQEQFASDSAPSRRAARGEGPILIEEVTDEVLDEAVTDPRLRELFAELGLGSALAVPLPGRDEVLGSMVLVRNRQSPAYGEADVRVATEAGRRAGIALDNARLYSEQHDLATELQRSLLTAPPTPEREQIAVRYVAAAHEAQVGGDWYDAFVQPDGATVLVVGDVIGHDRHAAAGMSQVRGVLRGIGYTTSSGPADLLARVDRAMAGLAIDTMATAVVVRLEPAQEGEGTVVTWSNAGHPGPLLMTSAGQVFDLAPDDGSEHEPDLLLGLDSDTARTTSRTVLEPGATLLLFSDGLVERRGEDMDDSLGRLAGVLERGVGEPLEELCDHVLAGMLPAAPEDDVALLAVRLL